MGQETKVGAFLLVALAAIMASIVILGDINLFRRTTGYYVDFKDVQALPPQAAVKISGVEVGKVKSISLVDGKARVDIRIDPKIKLYQDAGSRIGSTGVIGTRFVEIIPGNPQTGVLEPGSLIQGINGSSVEDMMAKLGTLFEDDPENGNIADNLKATMANLRHITDSLNMAIGDHPKEMKEIVMNVRDLTQSVKVFSRHLEEISTEKKEDFKMAIEKFRGVGEKLDAILAKVQRGEGAIGALMSDEKTAGEVKEAVTSIKETAQSAKKVVGRFTMINTYWNYRYRYDFKDDEGRSDIGVTFVPRPGKFYSIGATNVGEPVHNESTEAFERKNRIMAVMGADYGPFTGYAGAIRSRGGVGAAFRPLWKSAKFKDRLSIQAEASDFSRDRVVKGERLDRTWMAVGLHAAITRWWWIGVRGEDILERSAFQAYTNIVFRDEDFAYLMGLASVAR